MNKNESFLMKQILSIYVPIIFTIKWMDYRFYIFNVNIDVS